MVFKNVLARDKTVDPKHYLFGNRKEVILRTRLWTNCSVLNHGLYLKNTIDSPPCRCNNVGTVKHFFLDCPIYNNQRITGANRLMILCSNTLLHGNSTLSLSHSLSHSLQTNNDIFEAVQHFFKETNRFLFKYVTARNIICKYVPGGLEAYSFNLLSCIPVLISLAFQLLIFPTSIFLIFMIYFLPQPFLSSVFWASGFSPTNLHWYIVWRQLRVN